MSRFSYFIEGEKNISGTISITPSQTRLYREARKQFVPLSRKMAKNSACQDCGDPDGIEIHHEKPVWFSVVEFTCTSGLESKTEFHESERNDKIVQRFCDEVNDQSNLTPLCFMCHAGAQKKTDRYYRHYSLKNYRIVFGIRNILRRKKYVGWKWG